MADTPTYKVTTDDAVAYFERLSHLLSTTQFLSDPDNQLRKFLSSLDDDETLKEIGALFDTTLYPDLPDRSFFQDIDMENLVEDGQLIEDAFAANSESPLAKLLYAVAWKNGDLRKFRSLKLGLEAARTGSDLIGQVKHQSFVFYQFGKHLRNRQEPIFDQHTSRARAFLVHFQSPESPGSKTSYETIRGRRKPSKPAYDDYLAWVTEVLPQDKIESEKRASALSHLDKIMFVLGKMLATKFRKSEKENVENTGRA